MKSLGYIGSQSKGFKSKHSSGELTEQKASQEEEIKQGGGAVAEWFKSCFREKIDENQKGSSFAPNLKKEEDKDKKID